MTLFNQLQELKIRGRNYSGIILDNSKLISNLLYQHVYTLHKQLQSAYDDEETRLIIFSNSFKVFPADDHVKDTVESSDISSDFIVNFNLTITAYYKFYYRIATMEKPTISIMDGSIAGVHAGISQIAAFKIATEKTHFSMPQGPHAHFCDMTSSFALSRLDGHFGAYLLLTGHGLKAEELVFCGLATHFLYSDQLKEVVNNISQLESITLNTVDAAIQNSAVKNKITQSRSAEFWEKSRIIERCFQYDTVEEILDALNQDKSSFAKSCLESMSSLSPTSLKVSLAVIRYGSNKSMSKCLDYEYCAWRSLPLSNDYQEVIKASLERRKPEWNLIHLNDVRNFEAIYLSPVDFAPMHSLDLDFIVNRYQKYLVPTNNEIRRIVFEQHLKSEEETIDWFLEDRMYKFGVKEKVKYAVSKMKFDRVESQKNSKSTASQYYNKL